MHTSLQSDGAEGGGAERLPTLRAINVAKTYPGVRALRGVDITVDAGEIRGLVGANGSGKSTFIKIVSGAQAPDPGGRIEIGGADLPPSRPWEARAFGVSTIYQELTIVPTLSAVDNVFLGDYRGHGPFIATREMDEEFRRLCDRLAVPLDPRTPAATLSVADLTVVEIIRAIRLHAKLLIMDEVSATLGPREREQLYRLMDTLARQGVAIIFVSHDLNEVQRVSHSTTVFRDGQLVRTAAREEWTHDLLATAMLGGRDRPSDEHHSLEAALLGAGADQHTPTEADRAGAPALSVRELVVPGVLDGIDVDIARGEIVGVAGLVGSGRSTLLKALAGAEVGSRGDLAVHGRKVHWPKDVPDALRHGLALLPEDRKREGLVLSLPTYDNVTLSRLTRVARRWFLSQRRSTMAASALLEQVDFRGRIDAPTGSLSGGNQQKALFAKWLHYRPQIYLIDEPTRGVDVGAKREMLTLIRRVADDGNAFLVVSSEFEELEAVCDRIVVLGQGRILAELRGAEMKIEQIYNVLFAKGAGDETRAPDGEVR